jgi:high-affinity Fe2+/Pb2+ permease
MAGGHQLLLIVVLAALALAGGVVVLAQLGRIEARKFMVGTSVGLLLAAAVVAVSTLRSRTPSADSASAGRAQG